MQVNVAGLRGNALAKSAGCCMSSELVPPRLAVRPLALAYPNYH